MTFILENMTWIIGTTLALLFIGYVWFCGYSYATARAIREGKIEVKAFSNGVMFEKTYFVKDIK